MSDTFKTIARFEYSSEAQIIKGRLEADGIQVFLSDNLTIDTDPLVSNAIGGVKLKVLTEDAKKAEEILRSIQKYSIDNEGNFVKCPNCKSEHVQLFSTIKNLKSSKSIADSTAYVLEKFEVPATYLQRKTNPTAYQATKTKRINYALSAEGIVNEVYKK